MGMVLNKMSIAPTEYPRREIYPRAPLEWVACEFQFPLAPALIQEPAINDVSKAVRVDLPVIRQEEVQTMSLGPAQSSTVADRRYRLLDMKGTRSAVLAGSAIIVETTHYGGYADFRSLIQRVLTSVQTITPIVGIERVGLRYVNEIRLSKQINNVSDWQGWVSNGILQVLDIVGALHPNTLETILRLESKAGMVTVRLASLTGGQVIGNEPLRRRPPLHEGPLFVVDIDSYWVKGDGDFLEFEIESLLKLIDDLHDPVDHIFQSTVTDRFREEMRSR